MNRRMNAFLEDQSRSRDAVPLGQHLEKREVRARAWPINPAPLKPVIVALPEPAERAPDLEEIRDEARREGELEGLKTAQAKIEALAQRYIDAIARLEDATRVAARPLPSEIVDLALATAAELVGHELSINRDIIANTIEHALDDIDEKRGIIVRLGKADLAYITSRRPELMQSGGYFVEDASLGIGGCVIETQQKIMDLSIARRMESVRQGLCELLMPPEPADGVEAGEVEEVES